MKNAIQTISQEHGMEIIKAESALHAARALVNGIFMAANELDPDHTNSIQTICDVAIERIEEANKIIFAVRCS